MKKNYLLILTILVTYNVSFGQIISEIDADQTGVDTAEFIEIKWTPNTSLNGYIIVLYNGGSGLSYKTVNLSTAVTDANGFYTFNFGENALQNGPDAVALFMDAASNFPNGSALTTTNLIDAIVYGTNDPDDTGLLTALGETVQYNDTPTESLNQASDGSFYLALPSPNADNNVLSIDNNQIDSFGIYPNPSNLGYVNISSKSKRPVDVSVYTILGKQVIKETMNKQILNTSKLKTGIYIVKVTQDNASVTKKLVIE